MPHKNVCTSAFDTYNKNLNSPFTRSFHITTQCSAPSSFLGYNPFSETEK